mmetsp:Transcript_13202/g.29097  ORF Transcript_13202/g.29097 Transcript_13202/m.29097 type:complete len:231 (-) Transcript_13202:1704-2396(-)
MASARVTKSSISKVRPPAPPAGAGPTRASSRPSESRRRTSSAPCRYGTPSPSEGRPRGTKGTRRGRRAPNSARSREISASWASLRMDSLASFSEFVVESIAPARRAKLAWGEGSQSSRSRKSWEALEELAASVRSSPGVFAPDPDPTLPKVWNLASLAHERPLPSRLAMPLTRVPAPSDRWPRLAAELALAGREVAQGEKGFFALTWLVEPALTVEPALPGRDAPIRGAT